MLIWFGAAPPLYKVILDPHGKHSAHASEGIDHEANERPVTKAEMGGGVDGVEQGASLIRLEAR